MDSMNDMLAEFRRQYEQTAKEHEKRLQLASEQYEKLLEQTKSDFEKYITGIAGKQSDVGAETPPEQAPAVVWTQQDGENLLIMNQQAAVMFMAIFDRMGPVFEELQKLVPKRK